VTVNTQRRESSARFEGRVTRAAVLRDAGRPLEIEELEIAEPGDREVLVRMVASGVCHSDYHVVKGEWSDVEMPIVLGHEGAGIVEAVGQGVRRVAPGDAVVLSWTPTCGECRFCRSGRPQLCATAFATAHSNVMFDGTPRLRSKGDDVYSFLAVGSFGEYAVVPEGGAVPIAAGIPLDRAAVVGCAVATGFGAATNTVHVPVGASTVVLGCGGVGLAVIMGCAAQSAGAVIAVDLSDEKLEVARTLGATHVVNAAHRDPVAAVAEITDGLGADFTFEAIGLKATLEQAIAMLAPGGTAVVVGLTPDGVVIEVDPTLFSGFEHRLVGSNYGSCNPAVDFPKLLGLYQRGRLDLDAMISRRLPLDGINDAFADMERGEGARSVIVYDAAG
jgi:S-(hydroxymethyl)glutathione dehydrogenase/alcohol dehydrogenase